MIGMLLKSIKTGLLCLVLIMSTAGYISAADTIKIGVMNVQKVLVQSEPGQKAKAIFEKKKSELEASFGDEQKAIQELQKEIEKKSSVWSKEKKDEKVLEFNKMRRDLKTKTEDGRMEMKRLQDKELEPIIKTLETVVEEYGEKNGFTAILDSKNGVVYFNKANDISDELIKELNKAMK